MLEYHAWFNIRIEDSEPQPIGSTCELELVLAARDRIQALVQPLADAGRIATIRFVNEECFLSLAGNANHREPEFSMLMQVLKDVAQIAPASYGVLYIWDNEEEPDGCVNQFKIWCLRRGEIDCVDDQLLSPCVPVIE